MKEEDVYLEILKSGEENTNDLKIEFLELLNSNLFKLVQSLKDSNLKVKYHQRELEGKFFRFGIGNQSLINLSKGNDSELLDVKTKIVDIFSVFTVTRMQIDSFGMMYYLLFDKIQEEELNMRYDIYKIHGLTKQSNNQVTGEYAKEMKSKILVEIEETKNHLSKNPHFLCLQEGEKNKCLNPSFAKQMKTEELMEKSGMTKVNYYGMWNLYSNHIHSEHISDRQFNAMYKNKKGVVDANGTALTLIICLTARLCNHLCETFVAAQKKFESFENRNRIHQRIWSGLVD